MKLSRYACLPELWWFVLLLLLQSLRGALMVVPGLVFVQSTAAKLLLFDEVRSPDEIYLSCTMWQDESWHA